MGYTNVKVLYGGFPAWKNSGFPAEFSEKERGVNDVNKPGKAMKP